MIGCCLIPLGICGLKNNSRRITYGIGCERGMPSPSPLSSLVCYKILFSHAQRSYEFLCLYFFIFRFFFCYFTLLIFTKIIILSLYHYNFFMKIIFIFSWSAMFRDVQECSGMFRHVPECSVFRVLSTPLVTRLCVNKIYNFHFSAYFKLFARSETKDHPFTLQVRVF